MPSFKLIGMFAAILALGLALLYAQRAGLAQGRAEGEANYNRLVAQHANTVAAAVESARADQRKADDERHAAETKTAIKVEARVAPRQAAVDSTIRAQREAERADQTFAACMALPLPDRMRREPAPAGPGGPTG